MTQQEYDNLQQQKKLLDIEIAMLEDDIKLKKAQRSNIVTRLLTEWDNKQEKLF